MPGRTPATTTTVFPPAAARERPIPLSSAHSRRFRRVALRRLRLLIAGVGLVAGIGLLTVAVPDQPLASSPPEALSGTAYAADLVRGGFVARLEMPSLPDPRLDPTAGAAPGAERTDPPADLADRIIAAEGGPGRNPLSSAAGYGQFIRTTWLDVFGRAYPDVARKLSAEQILALREVRPLANDLTARYSRENAAVLTREGLPVSEPALSLAHVVGAGGAISIMMAPPRAPVARLLSPEAVAANPAFGQMTAEEMQRWAAARIGSGITMAAARPPASPPPPEPMPTLGPGEDFRFHGKTMASEVLHANRTATVRLREMIGEAAPGKGVAALFDAIRGVSRRPGYDEFRVLEQRGQAHGRLSADLLRDLAMILIGKMSEENATILRIGKRAGEAAAAAHRDRALRIGGPAANAPREG